VNCLVTFTLLRQQYPVVSHVLTHSVNLVLGPQSGSKNKCRVRACDFRLGLQNDARLKLWVTGQQVIEHLCLVQRLSEQGFGTENIEDALDIFNGNEEEVRSV